MQSRLEFLPLLLLLFLAFLIPPIVSRIRWLPVVVSEIIVGMIVGKSGFNLVKPDPTLDFLAEIGLAILMFVAGLEIDFSLVLSRAPGGRRRGISPIVFAAVSIALTLALAGLISSRLADHGLVDDPWMVGLILSTTSLGIVLPVLKDGGLSGGPFGQTVLLAALFADFVTMFLITVYVALKSSGLSLDILLVVVLFVVALIVYQIGRAVAHRPGIEPVLEDLIPVTSQTKIHGAIALLFAFVILSYFLGTEMILGAFLAGSVIALLGGSGLPALRSKFDAIGFGFFIPLFFLIVGINFNFTSLVKDPRMIWLVPVLLISAYVVKIIPSLVLKVGFTWRETFAAGILLSSRLSLIIAAAGIGLRLGAIDETTTAVFILTAAVTSTVSPVLFNSLVPTRGTGEKSGIAIIGENEDAVQTGRELTARKEKVLFIVSEVSAKGRIDGLGFSSVLIHGLPEGLRTAKLPRLKSLLVMTPTDDENESICRVAKSMGLQHIVVLVNQASRLGNFRDLGVQVFAPGLFRPSLLALMARNPDLFNLLISTREDHQITEITVFNRQAAGLSLRELGLGADILIIAVKRGDDYLVPKGETKLEVGDWITVYGETEQVDELRSRLE
jgi:Kef-type K+ transport system membrane component KefB/Trk K+ transport system NAD-binding subunit